jgi:CDP-6-deoxy-D-xylo-4-hexulose-3-dehydrase
MGKYSLASSTWDDEEIQEAIDVIKSKNTTMGSRVFEFEKLFAHRFGSKFAVMSNSGSSANLLAIAALMESGCIDGKERTVLVPAVSWSTTYFPFHQYGFKLRFADVDIDTLNYDLSHVDEIIKNEKIDCICAVNLLGNSNDFSRLKAIVGDLPIIEDNCESMGAKFQDKECGTHGQLGSFSTFFSHHLCTMEGGVTVTDDEKLYHLMLAIRAHGWTRNLPHKNYVTGIKSNNTFEESFKFVVPGYNLRPLEIEAAIGMKQLPKLDNFISVRRHNAAKFAEKLHSKYDGRIKFQSEIGESSWFGFSMIFESQEGRNNAIDNFNNAGIDCRPIVAGNFCRQPVMSKLNYKYDKIVNADAVNDRGLFVGNHHYELVEEFDLLDKTLERVLV